MKPPSRLPSVNNTEAVGIGGRAKRLPHHSVQFDADIEGGSVGSDLRKIFRNIGRAVTHTWNRPATPLEKAVLKPAVQIAKPIVSTLMPEIAPVAKVGIDAFADKYGVGGNGLYMGRQPVQMRGGSVCSRAEAKRYIKR